MDLTGCPSKSRQQGSLLANGASLVGVLYSSMPVSMRSSIASSLVVKFTMLRSPNCFEMFLTSSLLKSPVMRYFALVKRNAHF